MENGILIGKGEQKVWLNPRFANRHGLIAGATGTGKTVSLQVLAEGFSRLGVPVFMADVKGDLSGISQPGRPHPKIDERIEKIGIEDYRFEGYPTVLWDLLGERGHPLRATIADMGPQLLARLMELNDTQEGVLQVVFSYCEDEGMALVDLKDLRSALQWASENRAQLQQRYGNVSPASIGAIQRRLLVLEEQGADRFFGEPALDLHDLMRTDSRGYGQVNLLVADKLMHTPKLYATFLLWLISELFETLPEVGDLDRPKLVFFFDEAHLLFDDAPKALVDKVEQTVKLIRSKGVGIYFITQSPLDIPEDVLGQLGNRVQHALRAFTPKDRKAVRAAAQTFRPREGLDTEAVITQLGVGEALVSVLDEKGSPTPVEQTLICPPRSRIGPATEEERQALLAQSPLKGRYDQTLDRESAHEILQRRQAEKARQQAQAAEEAAEAPLKQRRRSGGRRSDSVWITLAKSVARAIGSQIGRQLIRSLVRSLTRR